MKHCFQEVTLSWIFTIKKLQQLLNNILLITTGTVKVLIQFPFHHQKISHRTSDVLLEIITSHMIGQFREYL